jgi:rod shape-determining protein MreC
LTLDLDDPEASVEVGDDVVTSGLENSDFPEGLSVGRVVDVEDQAGGLGKTLRVEPWTDFGELELVRVLLWVPGSGPVVSTTTTTTTTTLPAETTTTTTGGDD